jgi:hypothetical protein
VTLRTEAMPHKRKTGSYPLARDRGTLRKGCPQSGGISLSQEMSEHYKRRITAIFLEQKEGHASALPPLFLKYGNFLAELYWATCIKFKSPFMNEGMILQLGRAENIRELAIAQQRRVTAMDSAGGHSNLGAKRRTFLPIDVKALTEVLIGMR